MLQTRDTNFERHDHLPGRYAQTENTIVNPAFLGLTYTWGVISQALLVMCWCVLRNLTQCGCHYRKLGLVARQQVTDEVSSFSNLDSLEKLNTTKHYDLPQQLQSLIITWRWNDSLTLMTVVLWNDNRATDRHFFPNSSFCWHLDIELWGELASCILVFHKRRWSVWCVKSNRSWRWHGGWAVVWGFDPHAYCFLLLLKEKPTLTLCTLYLRHTYNKPFNICISVQV